MILARRGYMISNFSRYSWFFLTVLSSTSGLNGGGGITATAFSLDPIVTTTMTHHSSGRSRRLFQSKSTERSVPCESSMTNVTKDSTDNSSIWSDPHIQVGLEAVRKACKVTTLVQNKMLQTTDSTITKEDESPVTIADFAAQAIILHHLQQHFPEDVFLAEETTETLTPTAIELIQKVTGMDDVQTLKDSIDLGQSFFERKDGDISPSSFWCLDPIDGTKGFLRMEQYCVALGLVENGKPSIGILACPNLVVDSDDANDNASIGTIFVAKRGHGCFQLPLYPNESPARRLHMGSSTTVVDPKRARFCLGVEQGFSDPAGRCKAMAKYLHGELDEDGEIIHNIRMDSQVKWGVITRGDAEFYVRLPKETHREWLWDVAPGVVVLEEIGGKVTDSAGAPLDFSKGSKLPSPGIIGAINEELHNAVMEAFQETKQ